MLCDDGAHVGIQVEAAGHLVGAHRDHLGALGVEAYVEHGPLVLVLLPRLDGLCIGLVDPVDPHECVPARDGQHIGCGGEGERRDGVVGARRHLHILLAGDLGGRRHSGRGAGRWPAAPPGRTVGLEERQLGGARKWIERSCTAGAARRDGGRPGVYLQLCHATLVQGATWWSRVEL